MAEKAILQKELLERLQVGDVIEGTVKNVTDFGAFVDLGGLDGLLHISEMSWGRVEHPKKVFKPGDELRVFVKDINDKKIALSLKFEDENPWKDAAQKFQPGTIVSGVVARMTDFGAFVELAPGVDALLHVSQISRDHVEKPSDVLNIGESINAKIVDFNEAEKKISLSMKALADDDLYDDREWDDYEEEGYHEDAVDLADAELDPTDETICTGADASTSHVEDMIVVDAVEEEAEAAMERSGLKEEELEEVIAKDKVEEEYDT
jgi:ribosomal protein S1